ncbi:unnamed protein product [Onchocerca flexuosa]|uniref:FERM domain-containing protein n=1 Tax=Onchocerca flexuosa TaxID=387005 RepID=A0A183H3V7_9BILA|nr:unnamed protein product [Onchocerca flexuosa]
MYIGVTHRGIYIYHISRMIHHITWNELDKVDYVGKEIMITPVSSYVSPYSSSFENAEHISNTLKSTSNLKNGFIKPYKTISVLKFHCPSAMFAKHLWRHILSQQAFFTENDAKHIKPKFSKPRIPLLTRGSTFRFPTSRVLHEIEVEGSGKRNGPQPKFTRYPLLRQAPRQHVCTTGNKYNSLPLRSGEKISEVIPENVEEENAVKIDSNNAVMNEINLLSTAETSTVVTSGSENTENTALLSDKLYRELCNHPKIHKCLAAFNDLLIENHYSNHDHLQLGISDSGMQSPRKDSFEEMLDAVKPLYTSTPTGNRNSDSHMTFATTTTTKIDDVGCDINRSFEKLKYDRSMPATNSQILTNEERLGTIARRPTTSIFTSAAKIFFSLLLFWLLLAAVAISLFEHDSPWLDSIPALDSVKHVLYEPLRHYILALYVRLGYH